MFVAHTAGRTEKGITVCVGERDDNLWLLEYGWRVSLR